MNSFRELCGKFKAFLLCKNLEITFFLNMLTLPQLTKKKGGGNNSGFLVLTPLMHRY